MFQSIETTYEKFVRGSVNFKWRLVRNQIVVVVVFCYAFLAFYRKSVFLSQQSSNIFLYVNFFYRLLDCPKANFGSLMKRQPHSPIVNLCALSHSTQKVIRRFVTKLGPKVWPNGSVGFESETFRSGFDALSHFASLPIFMKLQLKLKLMKLLVQ